VLALQLGAGAGEDCGDLIIIELGSPVGVVHHEPAWIPERLVPVVHRSANRETGVTRGRLDIQVVETGVFENLAVGHAVEGDAAGEAKLAQAGRTLERAQAIDNHFFDSPLQRSGDIVMAHCERRRRIARFA
jgi:hypothetical protein